MDPPDNAANDLPDIIPLQGEDEDEDVAGDQLWNNLAQAMDQEEEEQDGPVEDPAAAVEIANNQIQQVWQIANAANNAAQAAGEQALAAIEQADAAVNAAAANMGDLDDLNINIVPVLQPNMQDIDDDFFEEDDDDEDDEDDDDDSDDDDHIMGHPWDNHVTWHLGPNGLTSSKKKKETRPLLRLTDLAINAWLRHAKDINRFEHELTTFVPKTVYCRILTCAMLLKKFRPVLMLKILKCWPEPSIGIGSVEPNHLDYGDDDVVTINEHEVYKFSKRIMLFLESFLYSLGSGENSKLKLLKLHAPDCEGYHRMLRRTLKRYRSFMQDLEAVDPAFGIETGIDTTLSNDRKFYMNFLKRNGRFFRVVELTIKSPFMTTDKRDIPRFLALINLDQLKAIDIQNERLFNHVETEGPQGAAGDQDQVQQFLSALYGGNQTAHPWLQTLAQCKNLETLSIYYASKVPTRERIGMAFEQISKERRVPSETAVSNWREVLKHLKKLKTLYLGGNCLTGKLEQLIGEADFELTSLHLENTRLIDRDYAYLAGSKLMSTITDLALGDFDLAEKMDDLLSVLESMEKIISIDLCLDGYERYRVNKCLQDTAILRIVQLLHDRHRKSLKFFNFASHKVTSSTMLKVAEILMDMPRVCDVTFALEGLEDNVIQWYTMNVKLPYAAGDVPREGVEATAPAGLKAFGAAIKKLVKENPRRELHRVQIKYLREGIKVLF